MDVNPVFVTLKPSSSLSPNTKPFSCLLRHPHGKGVRVPALLFKKAIRVGALDLLVANSPRHPSPRDVDILCHFAGETWNVDEAHAIIKMWRSVLRRVGA